MSPVSNEYILYTLAQVATTLAGFSGLVVVFRVRGAQAWSRAELRTFWFLLGDSFLVLFFSLIPLPLAFANWSQDTLWGLCMSVNTYTRRRASLSRAYRRERYRHLESAEWYEVSCAHL